MVQQMGFIFIIFIISMFLTHFDCMSLTKPVFVFSTVLKMRVVWLMFPPAGINGTLW